MENERKKSNTGSSEEGLTSDTTAVPSEITRTENSSKNSNLDEQSSSFTLKLITYNIDGYNEATLITRAEAVCKIIEAEQADVVFLQEAVLKTAEYIEERLPDYHCYFPEKDVEDEANEKHEKDIEDEANEKDEKDVEDEANEKDEKDVEDEVNEKDEKDGKDEKDKENVEDREGKDGEGGDEDARDRYLTGTLLKKSSVSLVDHEVIDFPSGSKPLLKINVIYKDLPICLLNAHLSSCLSGSEKRKTQLQIVFRHMLDAPENETVIFGGDMNLRDEELTELGGLPTGIEDVWMVCGSQKRSAYTFDTFENDNLKAKWKARCRFDRVYIRRSSPSKLKPSSFKLIGLERLPFYGCFPSDHWGVLCQFEKDDFRFKLNASFSPNNHEVQSLQPYWIRKTQKP